MASAQIQTSEVQQPSGNLQRQIQARIDSLSYLPTTAAVAIKFVELGKNPEAEPGDYAKVISADSSLSSKLLSLANSSWAGVRTRVTTVRMAVNLLGLGTVRTLAISYCMAGLHNELQLTPQESEIFWESSLSKAVAAKHYASLCQAKNADEAFVAGLFQDFALPILYSVSKQYLDLLKDAETSVQGQLERERELFGTDHAEVGRTLAQKLELPELFVDTVAFHHSHDRLTELVAAAPLRDATYAASLLPHTLDGWSQGSIDALSAFLRTQAPGTEVANFVSEVQREFAQLYGYFNEGKTPQAELTQLLTHTAREVADQTTELVGTVNEFLREAATLGTQVEKRVQVLENRAQTDPLTGALNREGFDAAARELLVKAGRYGVAFVLGYVDIDRFKPINDTLGHAFGDLALKALVAEMQDVLPANALVGRRGGDEFVVLLDSCGRHDAVEIFERLLSNLASRPVRLGDKSMHLSLSIGLLCAKPSNHVHQPEQLLNAADKLMYAAKQAGGHKFEVRVI